MPRGRRPASPAGRPTALQPCTTLKKGAHGGNMVSPVSLTLPPRNGLARYDTGRRSPRRRRRLEVQEERGSPRRSARRRARARCSGLRWRRRRRRTRGAAVVVVYGGRVRGRREPRLHHRFGSAAAGRIAHADAADQRRDPQGARRTASIKAGDYAIGFQACDDATAQAGKWDSGKCSQNANAYAANDKVIGVIGTFNSGCAAIIIPVLNQAPEGGIPMISPANTYPCLTVNLPGGCDATEPDKYYPSGSRNYTRVAPADDYQGAAVAEFMKDAGCHEGVHPERQGGLRPRCCDDHAEGSRVPRYRGRRLRGLGSEGGELRVAVARRSRAPGRTASSSAASSTRTAPR